MDSIGTQANFDDISSARPPPAVITPPPQVVTPPHPPPPPPLIQTQKPPASSTPPPKPEPEPDYYLQKPSGSPYPRRAARTPSPRRSRSPRRPRTPSPHRHYRYESPPRERYDSPPRERRYESPPRERHGSRRSERYESPPRERRYESPPRERHESPPRERLSPKPRTPSPQLEPQPSTSGLHRSERPMSVNSADSLVPRSYADNANGDRASSHLTDWTLPTDSAIQVTSKDVDQHHRYIESEVTFNEHTSTMAVTLEKKLLPDSDSPPLEPQPANYLPLTVCCCLINPFIGLMAILASISSIRHYKGGQIKESKRHGRNAGILAIVSFVITAIIIIVVVSIVMTGGTAAAKKA